MVGELFLPESRIHDLLIPPYLTYIMYFPPVNAFLYILRNFYDHEILSVNWSFSADFFQRV